MTIRLDRDGVLFRSRSKPDLSQVSGTTVEHLSGSEGPRHDPYHYDKWVVKRNGHHIVGKFGLAVLVWVDGECVDGLHEDELEELFEKLVGVSMRLLERYYMKYQHRCRKCGYRLIRKERGYPGESFNVCVKCGEIVSTDFDESEII